MKTFSLLATSEGPRREFKITWGLRAGYGPSGRIYDLEEAIRAAHRWMRERDARAQPFLSGMFTRGEVVSAGSRGEAAHEREPVAIFTCEVLPLYATDLDDDTARIICAATVRRRSFSVSVAVGSLGKRPEADMVAGCFCFRRLSCCVNNQGDWLGSVPHQAAVHLGI